VEISAKVLAAPLWSDIGRRPPEEQKLLRTLRQVYGSLLLNGPFTVIIAHQGQMIGFRHMFLQLLLPCCEIGAKEHVCAG